MKAIILMLSLLTMSTAAYADIVSSPTEPFSFCGHERSAGYTSCEQSRSTMNLGKNDTESFSSSHDRKISG